MELELRDGERIQEGYEEMLFPKKNKNVIEIVIYRLEDRKIEKRITGHAL